MVFGFGCRVTGIIDLPLCGDEYEKQLLVMKNTYNSCFL
jgi:hypothetical protein